MWSVQAVRDSKIDHTICPPCAEPEVLKSAVGCHWNTHTHCEFGTQYLPQKRLNESSACCSVVTCESVTVSAVRNLAMDGLSDTYVCLRKTRIRYC